MTTTEWGVFETDAEIHVAPCTLEGSIACGHVLSERCHCLPDKESLVRPLFTHRHIN